MQKRNDYATESMDSFRRIVHALRSSHRAATDVQLTGAQLFVLATLAGAEQPLGIKELAEQTRTDQSTVSVVVRRVVDRGLIKRAKSSSDSRRVELSLTARGRAVFAKTPTTVPQQRLAAALAALSRKEGEMLARILRTIVEKMGESDAPAPMLFDEGDAARNSRAKKKQRRVLR